MGISSNALFKNSANNYLNRNLSLDANLLSTFYQFQCWLLFCFCLCKNYVNT